MRLKLGVGTKASALGIYRVRNHKAVFQAGLGTQGLMDQDHGHGRSCARPLTINGGAI